MTEMKIALSIEEAADYKPFISFCQALRNFKNNY